MPLTILWPLLPGPSVRDFAKRVTCLDSTDAEKSIITNHSVQTTMSGSSDSEEFFDAEDDTFHHNAR